MNLRHALPLLCCLAANLPSFAQVIYINDSNGRNSVKAGHFSVIGKPEVALSPVNVSEVSLLDGLFSERYLLNRKYLMSLDSDKLLQNFYYEAGISKTGYTEVNKDGNYGDFHWGWESPSSQLRGHFLGHWLSAAAYLYAETGDSSVKEKADRIVDELAVCQKHNGGEWAGSIPEKYLRLMADGQPIWSPQYTLHKTLMGLYDMYAMTGSWKALEVLDRFADWFHRWSGEMVADGKSGAVYGGETSGMLEIWADMFAVTKNKKYLDLMERYGSPGMFQELLDGKDALSCQHANASIPWTHGAARVYEVTGDPYWRDVTMAFWREAVLNRESFCTGGQNAGEFWIPAGHLAEFAGENNQEHCTVYNMIRTADYLYRWTGDARFADYIERNIYNGLLSQQNPSTGMVAYFLPMGGGYHKGGEKGWGHPTMDFYCCHGTLVQAQTRYLEYIYYTSDSGLTVSQYIPSKLNWDYGGSKISVSQDFAVKDFGPDYSASRWRMKLKISAESLARFALTLRVPWWVKGKPVIKVNGEDAKFSVKDGYVSLERVWKKDNVYVEFPTELYTVPLPGRNETYAFMEGPIVLAGLLEREETLKGDPSKPETILAPEYHQQYKSIRWQQTRYRTLNQEKVIRFVPLYEVADEPYVIYFQVK